MGRALDVSLQRSGVGVLLGHVDLHNPPSLHGSFQLQPPGWRVTGYWAGWEIGPILDPLGRAEPDATREAPGAASPDS